MKTNPASEYALLGILMSGPVHGYEILRTLKEGLGSTWRIPTSQLYAQLKRLEERRLVSSKMEHQDDRPSKRIFSLTEHGRKAFQRWVLSPSEHVRDLRIEFLAKLYFIKALSLDGSGLIKAQSGVLKESIKRIKSSSDRNEDPYHRLALEFKLATTRAWLSWLEDTAQPFVEAFKTNA